MIITENLTIKGRAFVKTYSDAGYLVEREGERYAEAIDPAEFNRRYTETDEVRVPEIEYIEDEAL